MNARAAIRSEIILKHVKGPSVLDVGCAGHAPAPGSPYWLHGRLRQQFTDVYGIDINRANIETLRAIHYDNLYLMSAEDFALDRTFDTIVAGEVIEHLSNPGRFLHRCSLHLSPGGRVILTTPYPFSLLHVLYAWHRFPKTCSNAEHALWFCPSSLSELVQRSGFRVVKWELIPDYEPEGNPSWKYRLYVRLVGLFRAVVPKRLYANSMLFILEEDRVDEHRGGSQVTSASPEQGTERRRCAAA